VAKYLTVLLCFLMLSCSQQQEEQSTEPASQQSAAAKVSEKDFPALHIQPSIYELGDIKEGEAAIATFIIRNNSNQLVELVDIQSSCGCTAAEPDSYVIPANGFTQLKVAVDTTAKQKGIKKSISLTDSLGNQASAILTFNVIENPHLKLGDIKGIFDGQCASCHFEPLVDVLEPSKLYEVGCAMCHGAEAEGAYAPSLRNTFSLASLSHGIAHGVGKPQMPGFAEINGGPLTHEQIESLALWLHQLPENVK